MIRPAMELDVFTDIGESHENLYYPACHFDTEPV